MQVSSVEFWFPEFAAYWNHLRTFKKNPTAQVSEHLAGGKWRVVQSSFFSKLLR